MTVKMQTEAFHALPCHPKTGVACELSQQRASDLTFLGRRFLLQPDTAAPAGLAGARQRNIQVCPIVLGHLIAEQQCTIP